MKFLVQCQSLWTYKYWMLIFELANKPYPIKKAYENSDETEYQFKTENGSEYEITFSWLGEIVDIAFSNRSAWGTDKSAIGLTGTGDAFRIFATVGYATRRYVEYHHTIQKLTFTADEQEPSRVKLYNTMAKQLPRYLPDFKLTSAKSINGYIHYEFTRKNQ